MKNPATMAAAAPGNLPERGAVLVDARGHRCPVPTLRLRRALETCLDGDVVELLADDPLAWIDVPHLVNGLGYQILLADRSGSELMFKIRKASAADSST